MQSVWLHPYFIDTKLQLLDLNCLTQSICKRPLQYKSWPVFIHRDKMSSL